jgi:lysophospholipase L1-like esterase
MRLENINDVASEALARRAAPLRVGRILIALAVLTVGALGAPGAASRAEASDDASDPASASGRPCGSAPRCDWIGTWATALVPASPFDTGRSLSGFENESIRMIVQTSIGGDRVRIRLSNAFGENDMTIGHATVGRPTVPSAPDIDARSLKDLSFHGSKTVVIPAGGEVVSDPVPLFVEPLSQLAVTIYLPSATGPMTWHWIALQTAFIYAGDHAADPSGAGNTSTLDDFFLLAGVEVPRERRSDGAVVVLGDSISDGFRTTTNANMRWPDQLARRIVSERHGAGRLGVLNLAISGNAISHDGDEVGVPEFGDAGVHRLTTDVLPQPGVRTVIVGLGLNDLFQHDDPPEPMIAGLQQIARTLHRSGLRVVFATLSPAAGTPSWTPVREATREAVNDYIRCTHDADAVVDVDAALRDPAHPMLLNPAFDSGDHVHLNDLGAGALAKAVPLSAL